LDGSGTNNTIYSVVGTNTLPNLSQVLAFNGSGYSTATYLTSTHNWNPVTANITTAMQPGSGFFIKIPAGITTNITLVGNVITGTNTYPIAAGYQIVAPSGPVAGTLDTTNGYKPSHLDQILVYTGSGYSTKTWLGTSWSPAPDPQLAVGQAVFLKAVNNTNWTQVLNVQ
jgi:hypothetical protein